MLKSRPPSIINLDDLMGEVLNLQLSKRRTRLLFSDSSLDISPEPKKIKEGDDIILSALNMAEDLQKPLQDILMKLEKLDAIEEHRRIQGRG